MAIGDIFMLTDKYQGSNLPSASNVYFYIGTGDGLSLDLYEAFIEDMLPDIAAMQPNDIDHVEIAVQSLFDPTDFTVQTILAPGTWAVEANAQFTAVSFGLRLPTRAIRPGSKRIGPVPEDAAVSSAITSVPYLAAVNVVRASLGSTIEPAANPSRTFDPVVVKRIKETSPSGVVSYRLPTSFGEATYAPITAVTVDLFVSHQDSRRP